MRKGARFPVPRGKAALAPSVLSADFSNLSKSIANAAKADWLHLDIMDGRFVPNLSFGPHIASCLRKIYPGPVDAHLMVEKPENFIKPFAEAGVSLVTVHAESRFPEKALRIARGLGLKLGITIRPQTPPSGIRKFLGTVDLVLVMSVNPGFGGQKFIPGSIARIREIRRMIRETGRKIWLQVDGGVNPVNAGKIVGAGADCLVMGSAFFNSRKQAGIIKTVGNLSPRFNP